MPTSWSSAATLQQQSFAIAEAVLVAELVEQPRGKHGHVAGRAPRSSR